MKVKGQQVELRIEAPRAVGFGEGVPPFPHKTF